MPYWTPRLASRGLEVWNDPHRFLLVEGARRSGKSISIAHTIMRHAVQWDGAEIAIVTKFLKRGEQGIWKDLIRRRGIVDQWIADGMTKYEKPPGYAMSSKMPYFRLRTRDGGVAEIQLHGLENEDEVEAKFKDTRFSMIYVVEADGFNDRVVFDTLRQQLRSMAVPNEHLKIILDTNPPEQGIKHWLYPLFFENPNPQFGRIHFDINDNPFLSPEEKQDLWDTYAYDQSMLDRYFHGKWTEASVNSVFSEVFRPNLHIIGEEETPTATDDNERDNLEILRPYEHSFTIETGWDLGDRSSVVEFASTRPAGSTIAMDLIDEVAVIDSRIGLDEFVAMVMEKMAYWERWMKQANKMDRVLWRHWSDTSSLRHKMSMGSTEAALVRSLSGGMIHLLGVDKGSGGSIARRVKLTKRMLFEGRLWVSPLCRNFIAALRSLPAGEGHVIDLESRHKHAFDAASYILSSVIPLELTMQRLGVNDDLQMVTME